MSGGGKFMKGIMVDNWFMEEVIADIREQNIHNSRCYSDLLMALVLWDEVYYPLNNYNWWNSVDSQVQNVLLPLDDSDEKGKMESLKKLYYNYKYRGLSEDDIYWLKWKNNNMVESDDIVGTGAIRYLELSKRNELDYLPCEKRQNFLREYLSKNNMKFTFQSMCSRLNLQDEVTKEIERYFEEGFQGMIDFSEFPIEMPVLANFIIGNATDGMSPIDFALYLKNEKSVIRYRKYLDEIDYNFRKQKWREVKYLLKCSHDAIESVISMDKQRVMTTSVNIFPVIGIELQMTGNILETIKKFKNNYRFAFLKHIVEYGITNRHLR